MMFNKQKKLILNLKILKLLFFSPLLISIPFYLGNSDAKAGLEFQWDQDSGYRRLKWFQKENKKRFRNTIFFFLRPSDRQANLLKITLNIPKTFDSTLKDKVSFCKVKIGGFEGRTKCIEDIPADVDINEDNSSLDIYPYSPIPSNKDSYAIVFKKISNPKKSGLKQFHSYGQYAQKNTSSRYLGSWTIVID
ncbi:conserved hypothetical protein [Prochlorococcus marinus subsp. pastoris str. CCMP1986]|uniref:DUF2808 domain-containing protein n=2 Tax=Prochlorococcaceae TaxID=2881426 RepID=Q7V0S2_PROMP|nr:conserved hypothetical protein [Prochlorococcus marinus subsp. pastoris str. CCMP1986]